MSSRILESINNIYNVDTQYIDEDRVIFIMCYADKKEIVKNSELYNVDFKIDPLIALQEYIVDYSRMIEGHVISDKNFNSFIDISRNFNFNEKFGVTKEFLYDNKIKFCLPTYIHFYDCTKYIIVTQKYIYDTLSLNDIKEFAYIYCIGENFVQGTKKLDIFEIEDKHNKRN